MGLTKGDTRSLDFSSHDESLSFAPSTAISFPGTPNMDIIDNLRYGLPKGQQSLRSPFWSSMLAWGTVWPAS